MMNTHTEHVTVTDARLYDCLEGECDHVDEDGEPEDMSACPILTLEVCVDCMAEHERGRTPEDWDDLALAEWPCPSAPEPDVSAFDAAIERVAATAAEMIDAALAECVWLIDDGDGEHEEDRPHDFSGDGRTCVNCGAPEPDGYESGAPSRNRS